MCNLGEVLVLVTDHPVHQTNTALPFGTYILAEETH